VAEALQAVDERGGAGRVESELLAEPARRRAVAGASRVEQLDERSQVSGVQAVQPGELGTRDLELHRGPPQAVEQLQARIVLLHPASFLSFSEIIVQRERIGEPGRLIVPNTSELAKHFRSQELAEAFVSTYDAVLGRWPLAVTSLDVAGEYGTTHVQACGPPGGKPLVLLHAGGYTSTVWFANAGTLGRVHRVYAVDQIGDAGKSVADGRPVQRAEDLMAWLDGLLDKLGLEAAAFCGHSYGGWLALSYALHSPGRVTRLALLDPTTCFAGMSLGYRLRAVPLLARPSVPRVRNFMEWETGQTALDPLWLSLACLGAGEFRRSKLVMPHRPNAEDLRASSVPALLVLAENSKAHNIRRIGEHAERLMPQIVSTVLPGATHHSIPAANPDRLNQELAGFLA